MVSLLYKLSLSVALIIVPVFYQQRETGYSRAMPLPNPMHHMCCLQICLWNGHQVALFDMPNLNRFDILSISIFCKIALSISIPISIFSKITISISIFLELPYRYRYRYRYFSELPYRYRYRYRYFQLLHIDIDIFQKCRYIDNRYVISIYRTGLLLIHVIIGVSKDTRL